MFCREQVARLKTRLDDIHAAGAELYAIGNGTPHFARAFVEDEDVTFPVFTDPGRRTYAAYDMKRGASQLLKPKAAASMLRALRGGHKQTAVRGDAWQNGGVVVVRPGGEVVYTHVEQATGDLADLDEVVAALR